MKSRTSSFNGTIFKKNMSRFSPVWILYLTCLILGMTMLYLDDGAEFWFASLMGELIQISGMINLFYAPLVAMLLFGDLYNSRMCNALHAMPLKRETFFFTNLASGLLFSLLPTAVMAALSIPLLMQTCVVDAWQIGVLWFVGTNLEYVCFFGIAVFSVFCVGNRFTMALVYALLNGGAFIAYWTVDTLFTPLFYGVVTPSVLVELLTPVANMVDNCFLEVEAYAPLWDLYQTTGTPIQAEFWCHSDWWYLVGYAAAGVVFLLLGLALYRRRRLECAGDAVASRKLEPVFQLAFSVGGAVFLYLMGDIFLGSYVDPMRFVLLAFGLAVGWFGARMLIERTIRVFRLKNWLGLVALGAAVALSFGIAIWDPMGIEEWTPDPDNVRAAKIGLHSSAYCVTVTDREEIEDLCRLQEMALEDRVENGGSYPIIDGEIGTQAELYAMDSETRRNVECRNASYLWLEYELENGRTVKRAYYIWADGPRREIVAKYLSQWGAVTEELFREDYAEPDLDNIRYFRMSGATIPQEYWNRESAESLLAAARADAEAGTMVQSHLFHDGLFVVYDKEYDTEYYTEDGFISISDGEGSLYFNFYPDSENVLNWLRQRGLLDWEVLEDNLYGG